MRTKRELRDRVALICGTLERAEASRLLATIRENDVKPEVMEAMRQAVVRIDGGLTVTTDALKESLKIALRIYARR